MLHYTVNGQSLSGTIQSSYDVPKQRLLLISAGHFIYTASQGQIDLDSAMLFASRMYGLNRLLPYNEGFSDGTTSPASKLIAAEKISIAKNLLNYVEGADKISLLLELGAYYLFKSGSQKADLDSALIFIQQANALSSTAGSEKWQNECRSLLGKYYYQAGNFPESQQYFVQVMNACNDAKDQPGLALAYENIGKHLPFNDPKKLTYLEMSLEIFRKLRLKEKEIEVVAEMAEINFITDKELATKQLQQILALQKSIGYRHSLYANYMLSYASALRSDYPAAMGYARQSLENLKETGESALACLFYTRMGAVYSQLRKDEDALSWYRKSFAGVKNSETQLFWYKSFLSAVRMLITANRVEEAMSLIQEISTPFPPNNTYDKMHLAVLSGQCYEQLKNYTLAEENFKVFISLADQLPMQYTSSDIPEAYYHIAAFYFNMGQYAKARTYLQKALMPSREQYAGFNLVDINLMLFKLDSASGNYQSALQHYKKYTFYKDSIINLPQHRQLEELMGKYTSEKKEQDTRLSSQSGLLQEASLQQFNSLRNIILVGGAALCIILFLLYRQYRLKQRTNKEISEKNTDLQQLVEEKEWLLKEVDHRVKNNLQTIVSLLESQSEKALPATQDNENKVYAMTLIRQTAHVAAIEMRSYLPSLIHHLRDSFNVNRRIHIHLDIIPVELDVSQAVPIGLIINEAVTNAIKYAFPDKDLGQEIIITMEQSTDQQITLTIADNGIGLPADFDSEQSGGLGIKLMKGLVEDIGGTFHITTVKGAIITIQFMANTPLHKVSSSSVMHAI